MFPKGAVFSCTAASPCSVGAINPNLKTPIVGTWNIGIQHAFATNLSLDVSYVGNHADREQTTIDLNQANLVTGVLPYAAQYPYLHFIDYWYNGGRSNYDSLQATLTKRLSHGFSFTAGYTYGHGLDNGSLNHPIIANPFGSVTGGTNGSDPSSGSSFGCECLTPDFSVGNPIIGSGDARLIQLGLKLTF